MPVIKSHGDKYRTYFETTYGKDVKHQTWLKYRRELHLAGLEITKENVKTYAKFKILKPRSSLTKNAVEKFLKFNRTYSSRTHFRGCDIKEKAFELVSNLKEDTFYKCFNNATSKRYKGIEKYSFEEAARVVLSCLAVDSNRYHPHNQKNPITINKIA